jgi:hypothetical protein
MPLPILAAIAMGALGAKAPPGPSPGRFGARFGGGGSVLIEAVVVAAAGLDGGGLVVRGAGATGVAFGDEAWVAGGCGLLWAPPRSSAQETKSVVTNIFLINCANDVRIQLARLLVTDRHN